MNMPIASEKPDSRLILVVEDHPLVAKFYRMALERAGGFRVLLSENTDEIFAAVDSGKVSLILLDVSLRETFWEGRPIDGMELSRMLKQRGPRPIPILLATAHAMAGDREKMMQASGADACLQKPIYDAQLLVDTVRGLLKFS